MFKLQEMKLAIKDEMTVEGFKNFGVENESTEWFQALWNHDLYHTLFEPREMAPASRKSHQNNQQDDGSSQISRSWATKQSTFFPHFFQVLLKLILMLLRSHLRDWLLPNHLVPPKSSAARQAFLSSLASISLRTDRMSPCRAWKNSTLALSQIGPMSVFWQLQTELSVTEMWCTIQLVYRCL